MENDAPESVKLSNNTENWSFLITILTFWGENVKNISTWNKYPVLDGNLIVEMLPLHPLIIK